MNVAWRRWGSWLGISVLVILLVIQVVPYGRNHVNPPIVSESAWDSPATRELAKQACFDCHSNETQWPVYASVAPVSWLIQHDVDEGRAVLNFSEWQRPQEEASESAKAVQEGDMPPAIYRLMPEVRAQSALGAALRGAKAQRRRSSRNGAGPTNTSPARRHSRRLW